MAPGRWVRLTVTDTGAGILPEVLPHIFEPFYTTKEAGRGTGLGLAQVYGIVSQHDGFIDLRTNEGEGTSFIVYLPAILKSASEAPAHERPTLTEGRGEKILVVEDDVRTRQAVSEGLKSFGFEVLTAANGREALTLERDAQGIDLVITDMLMPEMGGVELIRELRKTNTDLKGMAITGYSFSEDLLELNDIGSVEIIHKPFDLETLLETVRRTLDAEETELPPAGL
jgi:CheY-like chemotaxis protein